MSAVPDVISAASTVVDAAELASISGSKIVRFFNKHFRSKIRVLVYGDSGVGKTQFLKTLTGNNAYSTVPKRTRQLQHYSLTLASGRQVELIDTPGHHTNRYERNTALNDMVRGRVDGIINLVDYGYQDSELVQDNPEAVFQTGTSTVKQEYLRNNRKMEISRTKEFIERIGPDVNVKWIITVINKADVWDSERDTVINYYCNEDYHEAIQELEHSVQMVVNPFCSVITPFGNKEMTLTYSERDKQRDYKDLIMVLEEFIQKRHGE